MQVATVCHLKIFEGLELQNVKVDNSPVTVITYGNNTLKTRGPVILQSIVNGLMYNIKYLLIGNANVPILGLNTCTKLNLIRKVDVVNSITDKNMFVNTNRQMFEGTGKIPFSLKENAKPFVSSCRRVPETVKPLLKQTLDDLVNRDIISKVEVPEWLNNIVIVEKPNKTVRICLDPLHLNNSICFDQHPIPTLEELCIKLEGKKSGAFSSDKSKLYTTFVTAFGKYCFNRLPFGLNVSPEVFQRFNEKIFGDLNIGIYFDNFIISADNEEEHDTILKQVSNRAMQFRIRFNPNKVQYKVPEVKYLGQVFSESGMKPDPAYIKGIVK